VGHAAQQVAFSADGKQLYATGEDRKLYRWDAATGKELPTVTDDSGIAVFAVSPDGRLLATGSGPEGKPGEGKVKLRGASDGKEIRVLKEDNLFFNGLVFSRDSKLLATAAPDQTVRVWDTASGQEQFRFRTPESLFASVAFSPDGARLAAAGAD